MTTSKKISIELTGPITNQDLARAVKIAKRRSLESRTAEEIAKDRHNKRKKQKRRRYAKRNAFIQACTIDEERDKKYTSEIKLSEYKLEIQMEFTTHYGHTPINRRLVYLGTELIVLIAGHDSEELVRSVRCRISEQDIINKYMDVPMPDVMTAALTIFGRRITLRRMFRYLIDKCKDEKFNNYFKDHDHKRRVLLEFYRKESTAQDIFARISICDVVDVPLVQEYSELDWDKAHKEEQQRLAGNSDGASGGVATATSGTNQTTDHTHTDTGAGGTKHDANLEGAKHVGPDASKGIDYSATTPTTASGETTNFSSGTGGSRAGEEPTVDSTYPDAHVHEENFEQRQLSLKEANLVSEVTNHLDAAAGEMLITAIFSLLFPHVSQEVKNEKIGSFRTILSRHPDRFEIHGQLVKLKKSPRSTRQRQAKHPHA